MGADAVIYAEGHVTDDQLERARMLMAEHCADIADGALDRPRGRMSEKVEFPTWARYYGVNYRRGPWPQLRKAIVCLRAALPHCTIHYGSDHHDEPLEIADDALLAELDELWNQHGADH